MVLVSFSSSYNSSILVKFFWAMYILHLKCKGVPFEKKIQQDLRQTGYNGFRIESVLEVPFVGEVFNVTKGSLLLIFKMFRVDTKSSEAEESPSGFLAL